MSNYFLLFFSLLINLFILFIYFSKKRIDLFENKMYISLALCNTVCLLVETLCNLCASNILSIDKNIIVRLFLILLLLWGCILTIYTNVISTKKEEKYNLILFSYLIVFLILIIPIFFLHIDFLSFDGLYYANGEAINYIVLVASFYILINMILILKNYKEIGKKKLPIIAYIFLMTIAISIHNIDPTISAINALETFVILFMYFTIENPDLKMIEQLNIARDQAEKANHAKTDFLSNMSHEIRTPLNAIIGFSEALMEEDIPPSAKEEVKDIIMASDNLLELVNGILDISKLEANKLEIVNTEYSLSKVLNDLVVLTKARIGEKPLEFRTNFDPSAPAYLYGDYARLKQIVLNLLTNAVKYTKEGYIEFKVSTVKKDDICRLIISVEDTGIGIQNDKIDKLFLKFERLDLDKNITIEGTGLGLAITKKLVELMQGKIVVQSDYGHGSKFTVAIDQRIIASPTKPIDEDKALEIEEVDASGMRILVVDDNKINLKVAERLLKDTKATITCVDSGFACIELLKNNTYDLILMDDMMPKMSGVETLHKLKEDPNFAIPTIAMTANAIEGMKEKYLSEGFEGYLSKPVNRKELNSTVMKYKK